MGNLPTRLLLGALSCNAIGKFNRPEKHSECAMLVGGSGNPFPSLAARGDPASLTRDADASLIGLAQERLHFAELARVVQFDDMRHLPAIRDHLLEQRVLDPA